MRERLIVIVTLMAFFTNMHGCGGMKNVRSFVGEIQQHEVTEIHTVQLSSRVRRIILKNGEVILVSDGGVQIDTLANKLIATNVNSEPIDILLKDVDVVQSASADIIVFDNNSGRIDIQNQTITGKIRDSTWVRIALSEICSFSGEAKAQMGTTTKIVFGVIGVTLIVALVNAMKDGVGAVQW